MGIDIKKQLKIFIFILPLLLIINFVSAANCWDYGGNQASCQNSSDSIECKWFDAGQGWCPSDSSGCCEKLDCWNYDGDKSACESSPSSMGCTWESNQYGQESWCPTSSSNPYTPDGTLVSGEDIGCCSMPGCWDRDGTNQSYCESSGFMQGVCDYVTNDPYCPDSSGECCMMPMCDDLGTNQTKCDKAIELGMPCEWSGSTCTDPGFGGFNGADTCKIGRASCRERV